ncbi:MAG: hypothetical protein A4C66_05980 [Nitrospira sp. HN-bin3]|uniref:hypothetical protein n=1 Tax=Nitrospira cf. moscoviensis SBR1015 TaxID=96242 RepID=UPI000A0CE543|nr:hypothetical protein [Nitrospira cf. moscoviensis SBR1015]OQW48873.1 MAG: hypothetical protein A4C66_05980 [Nitrospira sp. HN-bin3]
MTQRTKDAIKVILPFIGTIFLVGAAWRDLSRSLDEAVPEPRFVADSIRTSLHFERLNLRIEQMIHNQEITNERLKEICDGIRAGCR